MNEQETIVDIIAEMRGMGNYQRYSGDHARVLADRLEAAHRREREALKRIVAASIVAKNANAPEWILQRMADIFAMATTALAAPATTEKSSTVGNAAKMREALEACIEAMCRYCRMEAGRDRVCVHGCETLKMANAALAAPPRNCDVGTAEEQDARFVEWRYSKPLRTELGLDALEWAQMPYKEGGEK